MLTSNQNSSHKPIANLEAYGYGKKILRPRDGHSANLFEEKKMIIFGGDRHTIGYNDVIIIFLDQIFPENDWIYDYFMIWNNNIWFDNNIYMSQLKEFLPVIKKALFANALLLFYFLSPTFISFCVALLIFSLCFFDEPAETIAKIVQEIQPENEECVLIKIN